MTTIFCDQYDCHYRSARFNMCTKSAVKFAFNGITGEMYCEDYLKLNRSAQAILVPPYRDDTVDRSGPP